MNLFTLDGRTLESFGLVPSPGHQHPAAPESRDRLLEVAGVDGLYDFGSTLAERPFELPLAFPYEVNRSYLQEKIRDFVSFLYDSKGRPRNMQLTFNYDPDKAYTVRVVGKLDMPRIFSTSEFNLPLVAFDPYAYLSINAGDIILDSDILLNSNIRLDDAYSFITSGSGSFEVHNFGGLDIFPIIEVVGSFTTLSIAANGKTFGYTEAIAGQTLTIDGRPRLGKTVKIGSVNKLSKMTGDFIELLRGINVITVSGTGLNCAINFVFKPKYL